VGPAQRRREVDLVINALENRGGQANPLPWLVKKTAMALSAAVKLVDLANEPDTNSWYQRKLKAIAHSLIGRLAPVVSVLCDRGVAADRPSKWEPIVKGGTAALVEWMNENALADQIGWVMPTHPPRPSTPHAAAAERTQEISKPPILADAENRAAIQVRLLRNCASWLLRADAQKATQRLLLWIMARLEGAEYVDVIALSRSLLADDIGATSAETEAAYRALWEAGVIEPVDYLPAPENPDCFLVRVALLGDNETKYPKPYQSETFGPGLKDGRQPAWTK
jgi:hypothetical protein